MRRLWVLPLFLAATAEAATYYVATGGADGNVGNSANPWLTLQHAADTVGPGDTVIVRAGTYRGFYTETSGTNGAPITFRAEAGVTINQDNPTTPDGINLEGADYVVIEGFRIVGASRAGIRGVFCDHVTFRRNIADQNGTWGIHTGWCNDLLVEENETSRSVREHGIYVANSGDRPILRRNRSWGNHDNGIHMNGDINTPPGEGIISNALVEENVIYGNAVNGGGSGINCDGVQDSVIQNNLLFDNHASGISLYQIDGGEPAMRNLVVNNTIIMASDARWALNIKDGSTNNTARNNILLNLNPSNGSIDIDLASASGFTSNYNIVKDRFSYDDNWIPLAQWTAATGQDANSVIATPAQVFVNPASDYHLRTGSPAINAGTATSAPLRDLDGNTRPAGGIFDIGAYESAAPGGADAGPGAPDAAPGAPDAAPGAPDAAPGGADAAPGAPDGGAGVPDAAPGAVDAAAGAVDAAVDPDGGGTGGDKSGCGCRAGGREGAPWAALGVLFVILVLRRRPTW